MISKILNTIFKPSPEFPKHLTSLADRARDFQLISLHSIACADDIVYTASKLAQNVDIRAHGLDLRLKAALLEAARKPECEHVKYIIFQDPVHKYHGLNTVVLENASAASAASDASSASHAIGISLDIPVPVLNRLML